MYFTDMHTEIFDNLPSILHWQLFYDGSFYLISYHGNVAPDGFLKEKWFNFVNCC